MKSVRTIIAKCVLYLGETRNAYQNLVANFEEKCRSENKISILHIYIKINYKCRLRNWELDYIISK
jgi:hypothetical protein